MNFQLVDVYYTIELFRSPRAPNRNDFK